MKAYQQYIADKGFQALSSGIDAYGELHADLFDFQRELTRWALEKGRAAIFADCGLGKTIMQLVWADAVVHHTGKPALILTPLAVAAQTAREAERFGIIAKAVARPEVVRIAITNYHKLHHFDPDVYGGIVLDESSILKSFGGPTRQAITQFMRRIPFRLLCTATAAPNDFTELGTSSEALGHMGHMDMLGRFFRSQTGSVEAKSRGYGRFQTANSRDKWRFKGHSELAFWRWVCTWARAVRKPSDLGFDDGDFVLPPLNERFHQVECPPAEGMLFNMAATDLKEQRAERRRTTAERCERVADLVEPHDYSVVWCHLNDESAMLKRLVPDSVEVAGTDTDDAKEEKLTAFARGEVRRLITKPQIGAWGLNLQHCAHVVTFVGHSYEQYYQSVRRCWRFGQKRPVTVDVVATEGEMAVTENLRAKAANAERMFASLVAEMNNAQRVAIRRTINQLDEGSIPPWLTTT